MSDTWQKVQTTQLKNLTQSQINDLVKNNYLSERDTLADGVLIHAAKLSQATYGGGGIIPSTGSIETATFTDSITTIQPASNEVWVIDPALLQVVNNGINTATITVTMTDGTNSLTFPTVIINSGFSAFVLGVDSSAGIQSYGMRLTNTLYLTLISDTDQTHAYYLPMTKEAI